MLIDFKVDVIDAFNSSVVGQQEYSLILLMDNEIVNKVIEYITDDIESKSLIYNLPVFFGVTFCIIIPFFYLAVSYNTHAHLSPLADLEDIIEDIIEGEK